MASLLLAIIYLAFISLGLPDALLGAAWPTMYTLFGVPMSYAGVIAMIISAGTVVSSLQSDRLTKRFGTGWVTAFSVALTAIALFGFSTSSSFYMLCLWAIPYGLGAGSVDASLNNYVALHYASRHMSWLHCMWGIGISIGPYIMGYALSSGMEWSTGYRVICYMQIALTLCLVFSIPLWKKRIGQSGDTGDKKERIKPLSVRQVLAIPGSKQIMGTFFCYCALEQTVILWGSSFMVLAKGVAEERAANFASMFCIGITVGRLVSGFVTMKLNDKAMIRLGQGIIACGVLLVILPLGITGVLVGLIMIGVGCAPVYPCLIHSTPEHFGAERSQAVIGVQMASAYIGVTVMPPLFGLIANNISITLFPVYLIILLGIMVWMHERLVRVAVGEN